MAANLCCTAEQKGRADSPELPNARIRSAAPTQQPLFPHKTESAQNIGKKVANKRLSVHSIDWSNGFRRSQSSASIGLPNVSPLSPFRLPSLTNHNKDGRSWAEVLEESFRHPKSLMAQSSTSLCPTEATLKTEIGPEPELGSEMLALSQTATCNTPEKPRHDLDSDAEQTTPTASNPGPQSGQIAAEDPRRSVHLHSMRISHHLRSGSLLSWDQLANPPGMPSPPRPFRQRSVSDQTQSCRVSRQASRCERHISSSSFTSSHMPSRWGKVINQDGDCYGEVASSIYSSRPESPPDSIGGSMANLSRTFTIRDASKYSLHCLPEHRRSNSFPTDNEETPRPLHRNGRSITFVTQDPFISMTPESKLARRNSVADTKKSKFREEFGPTQQKKASPTVSLLKLLNPKRLIMHSHSEGSLKSAPSIRTGDGAFDTLQISDSRERRQSRSLISLSTEHQATKQSKGADQVWDRAWEAHRKEKASLFLPENRENAMYAPLFRERSGSISPGRISNSNDSTIHATEVQDIPGHLPSTPLSNPASAIRRTAISGQDVETQERELAVIFDKQGDRDDVVGAWGRYPSHTRIDRCASAGKADQVETRDFALEAAIRFASGKSSDDEGIDPVERVPSLPLLPGQKKRKKRVGGRMMKSNSMTFGKTFLKNYSRIFKSQSTEFRKYGNNHRSSIAENGTLEYPELELLPEVWASGPSQNASSSRQKESDRLSQGGKKEMEGTLGLQANGSSSTLRPRRHSDIPDLSRKQFLDGAVDSEHSQDRARVWSAYYENCMPTVSRLNSEADLSLEMSSGTSRVSLGSRPSSLRSCTLPARATKHFRKASEVSGISTVSHRSIRPRRLSLAEGDATIEERSIFSVRRSTMDLVLKFKEQETAEHEKVLSFTRSQSQCSLNGIRAL